MIDLKKILFATDFSAYSANARPYAIEFARKFGAEVTIINVLMSPSYAVSPEFAVDLTKIQKDMQSAAEANLAEIRAVFEKEGIPSRVVLEVGSPFSEIVKTAEADKIDLIIMATHGHGAVKHMLLGSTAEKVVRKAPCPVLTIRHPEHEFVHPKDKND
jgi:nucleotide-binding universal stress UspA family protein